MKVVILAGGYGTRISEETVTIPKPLVEVGSMPILWHIMKIYGAHGLTDFVICCGYKGHMIKRYFLDFFHRSNDMTVDLRNNSVEVHRASTEPWRVTLADTGLETKTGGRLKRIRDYLDGEPFCLTYGDCVSDVNIRDLVRFHEQQCRLATATAVRQAGRFGALDLSPDRMRVHSFRENGAADSTFSNGGLFVCEPEVLDYIDGDETVWERAPLKRLASEGELAVYHHKGFWQNLDTLRDKQVLERLWESGQPPWKAWDLPPRASVEQPLTAHG